MGAWIETESKVKDLVSEGSHPVWVRGLKQFVYNYFYFNHFVAPRVGAWIETY